MKHYHKKVDEPTVKELSKYMDVKSKTFTKKNAESDANALTGMKEFMVKKSYQKVKTGDLCDIF